jgi:pimeloyl-ACP methyl ester carboxylesterase
VGEQRLKAAVLVAAGLMFDRSLPEADLLNFLPRFRVPTVMVGGRFDFAYPLETSQRPMFRLLGASDKEKRLVSWDGGHAPPNFQTPIKEALNWFDRYLGPVK